MTVRRPGRTAAVAVLFAAAGVGGCRADPRPLYQSPPVTAGVTVTLKGDGGWFIDEVDGSRVVLTGFDPLALAQGNEVPVTPGRHRVRARYSDRNGGGRGSAAFTYTFVAGHTYAFIPHDFISPQLRVVDDSVPGSPQLQSQDE